MGPALEGQGGAPEDVVHVDGQVVLHLGDLVVGGRPVDLEADEAELAVAVEDRRGVGALGVTQADDLVPAVELHRADLREGDVRLPLGVGHHVLAGHPRDRQVAVAVDGGGHQVAVAPGVLGLEVGVLVGTQLALVGREGREGLVVAGLEGDDGEVELAVDAVERDLVGTVGGAEDLVLVGEAVDGVAGQGDDGVIGLALGHLEQHQLALAGDGVGGGVARGHAVPQVGDGQHRAVGLELTGVHDDGDPELVEAQLADDLAVEVELVELLQHHLRRAGDDHVGQLVVHLGGELGGGGAADQDRGNAGVRERESGANHG